MTVMCALDFCRALNERPRVARWLFRLAVGRYAYREYELMVFNLDDRAGYDTHYDYDLYHMDYHKQTMQEIKDEWEASRERSQP